MTEVTIRTNNVPREVLSWCDLTPKEQKEFDWVKLDEEGCDQSGHMFVRYKKQVLCLSNFIRAPDSLKDWGGVEADSYFSATLMRWVPGLEGECVVIGQYFC